MAYRIVDIECYQNFFLLLALDPKTGTIYRWERHNNRERGRDAKELRTMLKAHTMVTFNGLAYDWHMMMGYIIHFNNGELKRLSDWLVKTPMAQYKAAAEFGLPEMGTSRHIDIMPIAPLIASLKIYAGRLNAPKLQDLPVAPDKTIDETLRQILIEYCGNDVRSTLLLARHLLPQIKLRKQMSEKYNMDLQSKSDPAIAEAVLKKLLETHNVIAVPPAKQWAKVQTDNKARKDDIDNIYKLTRKKKPIADSHITKPIADPLTASSMTHDQIIAALTMMRQDEWSRDQQSFLGLVPEKFKYDTPPCVTFASQEFAEAKAIIDKIVFRLSPKGRLLVPPELRKPIKFNGCGYKMGIGGLHSTEKSQSIVAKKGEYLTDLDVTSYYPALILTNQFYPAHIRKEFLLVYKSIVHDRIRAKREGNSVAADSLKIVINSSFGKFGSPYSAFYSPKLLLQTTISGQLYLLMLIERIEMQTKCKIVSANTDGVTVHSPSKNDYKHMLDVAAQWERETFMDLEAVQYRSTHARDVNNYLAIKTDGTHKGKGVFAGPSLSKNPQFPIIADSVIAKLKTGMPVAATIKACTDICQFVALRKATGGAVYRDNEVGSTVRWYVSRNGSPLLTRKTASRIPLGENAQLVNDLPDQFPDDIDYDFYIAKAQELLNLVGAVESSELC